MPSSLSLTLCKQHRLSPCVQWNRRGPRLCERRWPCHWVCLASVSVFFPRLWTNEVKNCCPPRWLPAGILEPVLMIVTLESHSRISMHSCPHPHVSLCCIWTNSAFNPTTDLTLKMLNVTSVLNVNPCFYRSSLRWVWQLHTQIFYCVIWDVGTRVDWK